jgi:hypothetical protein
MEETAPEAGTDDTEVTIGTEELPRTFCAVTALMIERPKSIDFMIKESGAQSITMKSFPDGEVEAGEAFYACVKNCLAVETKWDASQAVLEEI